VKCFVASCALALWLGNAAAAETPAFDECVKSLRSQAETQHIDATTADAVFTGVHFDQRVLDLDRKQPEFTETLANYLSRAVTPERVKRARELTHEHKKLLAQLYGRYGIPSQYLVALWGMESNFGSILGNYPTFDALGTLACDERRGPYFTTEFMAALQIAARHDIPLNDLLGSWAGAIGATQFMPTVYLKYAVDGDGDGHADLRHSVADALASTANYLSESGWKRNQRWGREVLLPKDFAYDRLGLNEPRPLEEWRKIGVKDTGGAGVAAIEAPASLLVPASHRGPAFLVYDNFRVLMHWNRSEWYVITAGYLADRIAGAPELRRKPPADQRRLTRDDVTNLQTKLNEQGFATGTPDGMLGPGTRKAVRDFQLAKGLVADGYPDDKVLDALGINGVTM
jgi:membrane-bound lytic murein transglycosylase B